MIEIVLITNFSYRRIPCPYPWNKNNCEGVRFQNAIQHCTEKHRKTENLQKDQFGWFHKSYNLNPDLLRKGFVLPVVTMEVEGITIISAADAYSDPNIYYQWVKIIGNSEEAKNWRFELKYEGQNSKSYIFESAVESIDESNDSIMSNFKCFSIPYKALKAQYLDENLKISYSIRIRNLKSEAFEDAKNDNEESGISDVDEE